MGTLNTQIQTVPSFLYCIIFSWISLNYRSNVGGVIALKAAASTFRVPFRREVLPRPRDEEEKNPLPFLPPPPLRDNN